MQSLAGTSGCSCKEWKGPFNPDSAGEMLRYYGQQLRTVEIARPSDKR